MPHPFAAHAALRDFNATSVTGNAPVLDFLVLSTGTFPVLDRTENLLAEKTALLGLVGAVVDCLPALDFAIAPATDGFR